MSDSQTKLTMKIKKIRFYKNGFGILVISPIDIEYGTIEPNDRDEYIIKGNMYDPNYFEVYTIIVKEAHDPKWGNQYELSYIGTPMDLSDKDKQKIFLSKILTEIQLKNLYDALVNPFDEIKDENVKELTKAKGIGVTTALRIIQKYKETIDYSKAYVELDAFGLTPRMIEKLVESYGSPDLAIAKIKENPYVLADEMEGIGWVKADAIALKSGVEHHSPIRVEAYIKYFLNAQAQIGNSYVTNNVLMTSIKTGLGEEIDRETLKAVLYDMHDRKILWWNEDKTNIGLLEFFKLEEEVASELIRLKNGINNFIYDGWETVIQETEVSQGWDYTEQQKEGIKAVLEKQCVMITGFGGTGKSSIVKGMLDVLNNYTFAQCALSGKASSRLTEVTGAEGYTIHRLLGFQPPKGFTYNEDIKMPYDIIIVDELSMVGGQLFYSLIKAIKNGSKLIMLCDIGQLESIGTCNIAKDIIESGIIKVVTLTQIHRQAQKSAIVTETRKIRKGIQITPRNYFGTEIRGELQDFELDIYDETGYTANKVIKHFKKMITWTDNVLDVQVLTPVKNRGEACTFKLNNALQNIYNPSDKSKKETIISLGNDAEYVLREGDKVLNVKNNYKTFNLMGSETPIFNGNIGIIKLIDIVNQYMVIDFQFIGEVIIPESKWRHIELAYAMTVHKSQGSEFKYVIGALDYVAWTLLTRELAYTMGTRAKLYFTLVAQNEALWTAIEKSNVSIKQTFLSHFLYLLENNLWVGQ